MIGSYEVNFSHEGTRAFTFEVTREREILEDTSKKSIFRISWEREKAMRREALIALVAGLITYGSIRAAIYLTGLSIYYIAVAAVVSVIVTHMTKTYLLYGSAVEDRKSIDPED